MIPTAYGWVEVPSISGTSGAGQTNGAESNGTGNENENSNGNGDRDEAMDETSDPRTPAPTTGEEGNKRGKVEKRFFMGDQGVNMWGEGMEVGSIVRDGISAFSLHPFFQPSTDRWHT